MKIISLFNLFLLLFMDLTAFFELFISPTALRVCLDTAYFIKTEKLLLKVL